MALPTKWGGLGIPLTSNKAAAAFLSSWSQVINFILNVHEKDATSELFASIPSVKSDLQKAIQELLSQGLKGSETIWQGGLSKPRPTKQKTVMEKVNELTFRKLMDEMDDTCKSSMVAATGPGAGAWLSTPTYLPHILTNKQFRGALSLRFGAVPVDITDKVVFLKKVHYSPDRGQAIFRHDAIARGLYEKLLGRGLAKTLKLEGRSS